MIRGDYRLVLACDNPAQSISAITGCGHFAMFTASTRMEAKAKAREEGWLLKRDNKCLCPRHAEEYRQNGYRSDRTSSGLITRASAKEGE